MIRASSVDIVLFANGLFFVRNTCLSKSLSKKSAFPSLKKLLYIFYSFYVMLLDKKLNCLVKERIVSKSYLLTYNFY